MKIATGQTIEGEEGSKRERALPETPRQDKGVTLKLILLASSFFFKLTPEREKNGMTGQVCSLHIIHEASGGAPNDKKANRTKPTYI